jgi:hypothetical protein
MKTKDFGNYTPVNARPHNRSRRKAEGPNIGTALLGVVCAVGVLGLLSLLYHFG